MSEFNLKEIFGFTLKLTLLVKEYFSVKFLVYYTLPPSLFFKKSNNMCLVKKSLEDFTSSEKVLGSRWPFKIVF